MTGHGLGVANDGQFQVQTELRTVNHRYLKFNFKTDFDAELESRVESLFRKSVQRGNVSVFIRLDAARTNAFQINTDLIEAYRQQLRESGIESDVDVSTLLNLPGVVEENTKTASTDELWPVVQTSAETALENLNEMRQREGRAMHDDMLANAKAIEKHISQIESIAPESIDNYANRIRDRINVLLEKFDIKYGPADVIREVGLFADRIDTSEEVVRLRSHLEQFNSILDADQSNGRKLDFLIQELLRETNTIGSKANHANVAVHVVEMKTLIDRLREMAQNIE